MTGKRERDRQTDRQTDREMIDKERQRDRQTDTERNDRQRQTDRQTDREPAQGLCEVRSHVPQHCGTTLTAQKRGVGGA